MTSTPNVSPRPDGRRDPWPAAAMFDLDGTLIDREPLMLACIDAACSAQGVVLTEQEATYGLGRAWQDVHGELRISERLGWDLSTFLDAVYAEAEQRIAAGEPPRVLPGGRDLVLALKAAGIRVALVTGSRHAEVVPALVQLDLVGEFELIVAADDYPRGKPAPDPYLMGAERLGLAPEDCVAFEDSAAGIASALAAGCAVVACEAANLPEGHPARQDLSPATWVVDTLESVTPGALAALVDRLRE